MHATTARRAAAVLGCAFVLAATGAAADEREPATAPVAAQADARADAPVAANAAEAPSGELRFVATTRSAASAGPLAAANRVQAGTAPPASDTLHAEAELRHTLRTRALGVPMSLHTNAWLLALHERSDAGPSRGRTDARFNELHAAADLGAWQASAGKKVLGWDVGYGFRPNDFVQQEQRRTLLAATPEGRPLMQLEHFGAEQAFTLVWVNPQHWRAEPEASRGAEEGALALRAYRREGALDAFGFARHGRRTGASLGAAFAWVASDALELHASARRLERHEGWSIAPGAADAPAATDPWRTVTRRGGKQWLIGANWTGAAQQGVLLEFWYDGTALPDSEWQAWQARNAALAAAPGPTPWIAGNLAWQAAPFNAPSLRRDNVFLRLSWQPERWLWSFDTLYMPEDESRMHTLAVQWQGERWRLNAAARVNAGPADALARQLPTRRTLLLAATCTF